MVNYTHWQTAKAILGVALVTVVNYGFVLVDALAFWWLSRLTSSWIAAAATLGWLYWDRHTPDTGSHRRRDRAGWLGPSLQSYYPVKIVRAEGATLESTKNYIMDIHPHGYTLGGVGGALYSGELTSSWKNIDIRVVTHPMFFILPVTREIAIALGWISTKEQSLRFVLRPPGRGMVVAMYSGGLTEMFRMREDAVHFYLKRRGFCRVALLEGASLVPAIMLGENLSYRQPFARLQKWIYRKYGLSLKFPIGRGIFQPFLGFLPQRIPQMFVVGAPIEVTKTPNPTKEQIERVHTQFVEAIRRLYEEYSPKYCSPALPLVIES